MNWKDLINFVVEEIEKTSVMVVALVFLMIAFLILSYRKNDKYDSTGFDTKWFFEGLLKNIISILAIFFITIAAAIVEQLPEIYGLTGDFATGIEGVSVTVLYGVLLAGIASYFLKCVMLVKDVFFTHLDNKDEEITDEVEEGVLVEEVIDIVTDEDADAQNEVINPDVYTEDEVGEKEMPTDNSEIPTEEELANQTEQ